MISPHGPEHPHSTKDIPHIYHDIPPRYSRYPPRYSRYPPRYSWYPPRYSWYPPRYSWYPPTVLNTPHGTEHPPRYWAPPTVLHTHYTGWSYTSFALWDWSITWWSGYCSQNKGECDLNQSNIDSFVGRVAKNNSENRGDRHKIHKVFPTYCFVNVITLVWKLVYSSNYSLFTVENTVILNCFSVTVLASAGLTKKHFGQRAILTIFSSRSPRNLGATRRVVLLQDPKLCSHTVFFP